MAAALVLAGLLGAAWLWQRYPRPVTVSAGKFPEELVYVRSSDDIVNGGVFFAAPKPLSKPFAVIWVHGWGVNFYQPTYVMIGRHLAERGQTTIVVNTRMHDIGTVAGHRWGKRIRGGGYWGVPSQEPLDIDAWIDFAEQRGFAKVVLVGHSAGWAAVAAYQVKQQDPRVVGLVLASGSVHPQRPVRDPDLVAQATRMVEAGNGDDLVRLPNRSFPSFISAATFLDLANSPAELLDFFGVETPNAGITRLRRPLLAFFGTNGDVGDQAALDLVTASVERHAAGASRVETTMISRADHMYTGEEAQVAQVIAGWADRTLLPPRTSP